MSNKLASDTSNEQHRAACEARWCLDQPREQRSTYYRMVAEKRGRTAAKELVDAVKAEHARREGEVQGMLL